MAKQVSSKRLLINQSTAQVVIFVSVASFVLIFSIFASRGLLSQRAYQSRVIEGKSKAKKQLEQNIETVEQLRTQYKAFVNTNENVLGGNPAGKGDKDGDNARIVLDALPSKYDFPALATSLEKLLAPFKPDAITGSDDEVAQNTNQKTSSTPQPIEIPFQVGAQTNYQSAAALLGTMEKSIRPIYVKSFSITAGSGQLQLAVSAKTYYQPGKSLSITTKEVR